MDAKGNCDVALVSQTYIYIYVVTVLIWANSLMSPKTIVFLVYIFPAKLDVEPGFPVSQRKSEP